MKIVILRISVLLLVVLCGAAIVSCLEVKALLGDPDDDDGDGGNGGEPSLCDEGATLLSTAVEVQDMQNDLAGDYCLEEDIDLSTITDFVPIGSVATPFNGTLNGNNKKLMNLTINRPTENDIGIFGVIGAAALIKDLIVEDANVTGSGATGILVGSVSDADQDLSPSITNVRITGTSSVTGGIVVGGMIGAIKNVDVTNTAITIADTDVTVAVDGTSSVGGLVGQINSADTFPAGDIEITNAQSAGTVTGSGSAVGGILGQHGGTTVTVKILNSSSSSAVEGKWQYVGGLVGFLSGSVEESSASGDVISTINDIANSPPDQENYVGGLIGYTKGPVRDSYASGAVSGYGGYVGGLIGDMVSNEVTNCYATGDVSGHTAGISGSNGGVGGLVGKTGGDISESYATGSVSGATYVGGLVGKGEIFVTITSSYATGSVSGSGNNVGGLVGSSLNGTITSSYATRSVEGAKYVGGLVGNASSSTITLSYATGSVTGDDYVGGFIGHTYGRTITSSYATGLVSVRGNGSNFGGFAGYSGSTITLSYFDTSRTGHSEGVGNDPGATGVIGIIPSGITSGGSSPFSGVGWNFSTEWSATGDGSWPTLQ